MINAALLKNIHDHDGVFQIHRANGSLLTTSSPGMVYKEVSIKNRHIRWSWIDGGKVMVIEVY